MPEEYREAAREILSKYDELKADIVRYTAKIGSVPADELWPELSALHQRKRELDAAFAKLTKIKGDEGPCFSESGEVV